MTWDLNELFKDKNHTPDDAPVDDSIDALSRLAEALSDITKLGPDAMKPTPERVKAVLSKHTSCGMIETFSLGECATGHQMIGYVAEVILEPGDRYPDDVVQIGLYHGCYQQFTSIRTSIDQARTFGRNLLEVSNIIAAKKRGLE